MERRSIKTVGICLLVLAALFLGGWLPSCMLPAWPTPNDAGSLFPSVVLSCNERDLGTVPQGSVLRTSFRITNAGPRRLVLLREAEGCCGQSADPREIIVPPSGSKLLDVEVNTAQWHGRMEHTVRYTTNDPKLPRLALRVTADVKSPLGR